MVKALVRRYRGYDRASLDAAWPSRALIIARAPNLENILPLSITNSSRTIYKFRFTLIATEQRDDKSIRVITPYVRTYYDLNFAMH